MPTTVTKAQIDRAFRARVRAAAAQRHWAVQLRPEPDGWLVGSGHLSLCRYLVPADEIGSIPGICLVDPHGLTNPDLAHFASVRIQHGAAEVLLVIEEVEEVLGQEALAAQPAAS